MKILGRQIQQTTLLISHVHNAVFPWRSFISPIVAMSTSETESIGVCACAQEMQFSRKLDAELFLFYFTTTRRQHPPNIRTETYASHSSSHCVTCKTCVLGESPVPPLFDKNSSMVDETVNRNECF